MSGALMKLQLTHSGLTGTLLTLYDAVEDAGRNDKL
jgi:hypothetical protein